MPDQSATARPRLRWGAQQRLEFIEFRLFWEGGINRSDLKEFFAISIPQASNDLRRYQELAPGNMDYDKSKKWYFATATMRPIFLAADSRSYFNELSNIAAGLISERESYAGWIPPFATTPTLLRHVEPHTLFLILAAIRHRFRLQIEYQSMSNPDPTVRWIHPHALGFDGFRWHIRAYCEIHDEFRDFLFSRILSIVEEDASQVDATADREWHEEVELVIAPHPGLSSGARKIIELDYGMHDGRLAISVRAALFFYLRKRLGLSEKSWERSPETQQIVALNWPETIAEQIDLKARSKKLLQRT